jgi:hypothetical protein
VRVVLSDATAAPDVLSSAWRNVRTELDKAGAVVDTLTIEAVDEIGRSGAGAKEKLVSAISLNRGGMVKQSNEPRNPLISTCSMA